MPREMVELRSFVLVVLEHAGELLPGEDSDSLVSYWHYVEHGEDIDSVRKPWGYRLPASDAVLCREAAMSFGGEYDPGPRLLWMAVDPVEQHFSERLGRLEGMALSASRSHALAALAARSRGERAMKEAAIAAAAYLHYAALLMCRFQEVHVDLGDPCPRRMWTHMPQTGGFLRYLEHLIRIRSERDL